jgi:hypothetical protein
MRFLCVILLCGACAPGGAETDGRGVRASGVQATDRSTVIGAMYHHWYRGDWGPHPYEPVLGEYDSADPAVVRQHVQWAEKAGINTFVMDTWIGDEERHWMDRNTPPALDAFDAEGMQYFFIADGWFNYRGTDPGGYDAHQIAAHVNANLAHYFSRPGYLHVDGKPVVFFWASDGSSCELWRRVRSGIEGTIGPIYMTGFNDDPSCWDRFMYYNPYHPHRTTHAAQISAQDELWRNWASRRTRWAPTASPGYDDTLVRSGNPPIPLEPGYFRQSMQTALRHKRDDRWLFVCSFNEWWEGSVIEPTSAFADSEVFLRIMREELASAGWISPAPSEPPPTDPPTDPAPICDPIERPAPHFMPVGASCLPSCGVIGGTACAASACPPGTSPMPGGPTYDCGACCG